uniref:Copia protein n=1 Tax=Tanacetum cinerariifolium TaxID=118510 RepID=A0A699I3I4_TANCI|nr:copia protein [Tanacetum cinerariifolium]
MDLCGPMKVESFNGYSTQSRAYRVYNKRTRVIVEIIHVNFDELPQMTSDHVSSDPTPQCLITALKQDSLSLDPQSQENVPQAVETITTSNELDLLFILMFDELLNGTTKVVSKSFTALYGLKEAPKAWYNELSNFLVSKGFSKNLDHAGCLDTRKSTSGGIQFLGGDKLVSWSSKK